MGLAKKESMPYPQKPPLSQAINSHAGMLRKKGPELNNAANEVKRRRKSLTVLHTQHRAPPINTTISTEGKGWGHEIKGVLL